MRFVAAILIIVFFASCEDEVTVKPEAKLRLEYPKASYSLVTTAAPYTFEKNTSATLIAKRNYGMNIHYPNMNATVYLTYQPVRNQNLDSLLYDAQKLTYDHNTHADAIPSQVFVNPEHNSYGMFYEINGNAATQAQFYVTDSLDHFLLGSLYFNIKPNFDSLYPAVIYLREDMRHIMETLTWTPVEH